MGCFRNVVAGIYQATTVTGADLNERKLLEYSRLLYANASADLYEATTKARSAADEHT
jgi:hypothetical protein